MRTAGLALKSGQARTAFAEILAPGQTAVNFVSQHVSWGWGGEVGERLLFFFPLLPRKEAVKAEAVLFCCDQPPPPPTKSPFYFGTVAFSRPTVSSQLSKTEIARQK